MIKFNPFLTILLACFVFVASIDLANAQSLAPTEGLSNESETLKIRASDVDFFAASLYCDVRDVIRGSLGTLAGLLISLVGGYTYLMTKSGYGLFFFIAGVFLTALPGIFSWYFSGVTVALGSDAVSSNKFDRPIALEAWCAVESNRAPREESQAKSETDKLHDRRAENGEGLSSLIPADVTGSDYACVNVIVKDPDTEVLSVGAGENCVK